jgi:hypothetical protein
MSEDLTAWTRRFIEWTNAGIEQAEPLLNELLHLFDGLLEIAEEDGTGSLPLTEFVLRHVDAITVPPEQNRLLLFLRGHARRVG